MLNLFVRNAVKIECVRKRGISGDAPDCSSKAGRRRNLPTQIPSGRTLVELIMGETVVSIQAGEIGEIVELPPELPKRNLLPPGAEIAAIDGILQLRKRRSSAR